MLSAPIWPNEERLAKAVGHDREWVLQERFVTHHPAGWRVLVLMVEKPEGLECREVSRGGRCPIRRSSCKEEARGQEARGKERGARSVPD